jgi:hypothetical protein
MDVQTSDDQDARPMRFGAERTAGYALIQAADIWNPIQTASAASTWV